MATVKDLIEFLNTIENPENVQVSVLESVYNQDFVTVDYENDFVPLEVGNFTENCRLISKNELYLGNWIDEQD